MSEQTTEHFFGSMEFVLKMGELKYFVVLSLALIVTFLDHALFVVLWFEKSLFFLTIIF